MTFIFAIEMSIDNNIILLSFIERTIYKGVEEIDNGAVPQISKSLHLWNQT